LGRGEEEAGGAGGTTADPTAVLTASSSAESIQLGSKIQTDGQPLRALLNLGWRNTDHHIFAE